MQNTDVRQRRKHRCKLARREAIASLVSASHPGLGTDCTAQTSDTQQPGALTEEVSTGGQGQGACDSCMPSLQTAARKCGLRPKDPRHSSELAFEESFHGSCTGSFLTSMDPDTITHAPCNLTSATANVPRSTPPAPRVCVTL
eukprot:1152079-Pelagomonas_calceolata.AAC.8